MLMLDAQDPVLALFLQAQQMGGARERDNQQKLFISFYLRSYSQHKHLFAESL
jgi:hypothetical protein